MSQLHRLFRENPLVEGEEVLVDQSVHWMVSDDPSQYYSDATLLLTNFRIGLGDIEQPFIDGLLSVKGLSVDPENHLLGILFDGDTQLYFTTDLAVDIHHLLLQARSNLMNGDAAELVTTACQLMKAGKWSDAASALEQAHSKEFFHPLIPLARAVVARRGGDASAGADLIIDEINTISSQYQTQCLELLKFPLAAHHLHRLNRVLGDFQEEDPAPLGLVLGARARMYQGKLDDAQRLRRRMSTILYDSNPDLVWTQFQLALAIFIADEMELLPTATKGLARIVTRMRASDPQQAREMEEGLPIFFSDQGLGLLRKLSNYAEDPVGSTLAAIELSEMVGTEYGNGSAYRVLEDWDGVIRSEDSAKPLSTEALEAMWIVPDAAESVVDWIIQFADPFRGAEQRWAQLRKSSSRVSGNALPFWKDRATRATPESEGFWISALTCTEALWRSGRLTDAKQVLDDGYQKISRLIGDSRDLYLQKASLLYGFYSALLESDHSGAEMYGGLLREGPGFSWTTGLNQRKSAQGRTTGTAGARLVDFEGWLAANAATLGLNNDASYTNAYTELARARECKTLSVVVGGETSSGKSSFINALIGRPVLYVTAEEATATPTVVRVGPAWTAEALGRDGRILARLELGQALDTRSESKYQHFVEQHSALTRVKGTEVARLRLTAPGVQLPENVELVDTPGLNAHSLRTAVAQETIARAHACIFLIDAGAALKGGEMAQIQWASGAVGKTLFVINKMDRAIGDDDLDVDDDASSDLLARVEHDLQSALGVGEVNLFAVCSLPVERLRQIGAPPEAIHYARQVVSVHQNMMGILNNSRGMLIEYAASKLAAVVAERALARSHERISAQDERMVSLAYMMPPDPRQIDEYVYSLAVGFWMSVRDQYIQNMLATVDSAGERAMQRVVNGIQGCADNDSLKKWVKRSARRIFEDFVSEVRQARIQEWSAVGDAMKPEIVGFYRTLYDGVDPSIPLNLDSLFNKAAKLPPPKRLKKLSKKIDDITNEQNFLTGGGAAAGAAIGTAILPVLGTVVGGILGGMAGNAMSQDASEMVFEKLAKEFNKLVDGVVKSLDKDIDNNSAGRVPILAGLMSSLEDVRLRFTKDLEAEQRRVAQLRAKAINDGAALRKAAATAWDYKGAFSE